MCYAIYLINVILKGNLSACVKMSITYECLAMLFCLKEHREIIVEPQSSCLREEEVLTKMTETSLQFERTVCM